MVKEHSYPHGNVFYRALRRPLPCITRGEGCYLYDQSGKRYLDASGGAFVANLGHGVAEISQACFEQGRQIAYVNGTAFTSEPAEELAAELAELSPRGMDKAYFLSSGSEAVEAALKLARQYWVETGQPSKHKIISRTPGYHGNTLLALSASAREHYRKLYGSWLVKVPMIPAPYPYRCSCQGAPECPACTGAALEETILREGPETVAAFIAEPVGGSSTGASVPGPGYYRRIREICDRHKVLFIADEVLCGAGRTGKWLAMEYYGVVPDIITMGKGISGGYVPLSAVITSRRVIDPIAQGSGQFKHAQTFSHVPSICAVGLAAIRYIKNRGLVALAAQTGAVLQKRLKTLQGLPAVGDVRGIGMLAGVEFVAEKASKKPFARGLKFAETFAESAQEAGLVVWPNMGQADGENGDIAMIAPPFIISEAEIDSLVSLFKTALNSTLAKLAQTERR
ncbi:MAG TPA: aspartate aminotransferase family protein [Elusimicrobia bacterium]|nr:aspartate aminotransferase family protein [Elusimicrobiota bacterium]HBT62181.1 aspartate aminotransferase family protein [Elusimicrobiota bacterium]